LKKQYLFKTMTAETIKNCKEFLNFFGVNYNNEVINLSSGGNMVFSSKNKPQWEEFNGCTINDVVEMLAKELNKKTRWV